MDGDIEHKHRAKSKHRLEKWGDFYSFPIFDEAGDTFARLCVKRNGIKVSYRLAHLGKEDGFVDASGLFGIP